MFYQYVDRRPEVWMKGWRTDSKMAVSMERWESGWMHRMDWWTMSLKVPAVVCGTWNKNLMANHNVTLTNSLHLRAHKYLDYCCSSFILSFVTSACFSPGDELPQHTISHISPRIPRSLSLALSLGLSINSSSLSPLFPLSTSQLSFCSALVLLVLKRSACMITTRPDLRRKLGREKGRKDRWRNADAESKRWRNKML